MTSRPKNVHVVSSVAPCGEGLDARRRRSPAARRAATTRRRRRRRGARPSTSLPTIHLTTIADHDGQHDGADGDRQGDVADRREVERRARRTVGGRIVASGRSGRHHHLGGDRLRAGSSRIRDGSRSVRSRSTDDRDRASGHDDAVSDERPVTMSTGLPSTVLPPAEPGGPGGARRGAGARRRRPACRARRRRRPLAPVPRRLGRARRPRPRRHRALRLLPGRLPPRPRHAAGQRLARVGLRALVGADEPGLPAGPRRARGDGARRSARPTRPSGWRCSSPSSTPTARRASGRDRAAGGAVRRREPADGHRQGVRRGRRGADGRARGDAPLAVGGCDPVVLVGGDGVLLARFGLARRRRSLPGRGTGRRAS